MAKGKSNKTRVQRDASDIATRRRVLGTPAISFTPVVTPADRTVRTPPVQDDRRTFHPLGAHRPPVTVSGAKAQLTLKNRPRQVRKAIPTATGFIRQAKRIASQTKAAVAFVGGAHVAVCIRRKTRRQVLAALRKFRAGAGSKRRHTPFSRIGC